MPGPVQDFIVMTDVPSVTVALEPVHNALHSLLLIVEAENISGLGDWVTRTAAALTPQEREMHKLVIIGFYYAIVPEQSWASFPAYIDHLASCDPVALRDKMMAVYSGISDCKDADKDGKTPSIDIKTALGSVETYLGFLQERFNEKCFDMDLETRAYPYVIDPPAMQELIVSHLQKMWVEFLAPEWEQIEPVLQDAVRAFNQVDFGEMSKVEAAQFVGGQALTKDKWKKAIEKAERIIFVPTMHIGPYMGQFWADDVLWILFGARLPEGVQYHAPALSRAEIVIRLSALADDNRLRILKLVSEKGELRSQDIMQSLGLSQSAASRHLKQLSATGYLVERRCNGAKCYELDGGQLKKTLRAVSAFLMGNQA